AGLGYLDSDDLFTEEINFPFILPTPPIEEDVKQSNAYLYNTFTLGNSTLLVQVGIFGSCMRSQAFRAISAMIDTINCIFLGGDF
ncbi:MAG: hypothetical protein L3J79_09910, partial [Candidatus Marinimicrobia bacterium]|nr:hypothetical protein [Candidatus Neomarinimicrobiota bacterium]